MADPARLEELAVSLPDEIDLFRLIRGAGRTNIGKARAVSAVIEDARRALRSLQGEVPQAELVEVLRGCESIESGPNGHGGMRVVVHFAQPEQETALFGLLNDALALKETTNVTG